MPPRRGHRRLVGQGEPPVQPHRRRAAYAGYDWRERDRAPCTCPLIGIAPAGRPRRGRRPRRDWRALRLARELHDGVSHAVGVMGLQAGAAAAKHPTDPDGAAAAPDIEVAGRSRRRSGGRIRRAGASGFLLKTMPPDQLLAAIRAAHAGDMLFAPTVTRCLVEAYVRRPPASAGVPDVLSVLTEGELDVFRSLAKGFRTRRSARSCTSARRPSRPM